MTESSQNTSIVPSYLTDGTGGVWSLVQTPSNGGQVALNGTVQTTTSNVSMLLYFNHKVYQTASAKWWYWNGSAWTSTTDPRIITVTESPNGTSVTTIGPAIVDSILESWTLVNGSNGMQIAVNGVTDTSTALVTLLYYSNHLLYQQNSAGGWWYKSKASDAWTSTTDPRVLTTITGITLSNSTLAGGASSGTVIGSIAVTLSSGTFSGTLALSGTNASSFAIVGNNLVTNGVVPAGTYSINIVATQTGTTAYTKAFGITASSSGNTTTAPPPAANAGYNTMVFFDDFTSTNTLTTSYTPSTGYNWYPANNGSYMLSSPTNYEMRTTTSASAVGGGAGIAPSPNGGVLVMKGAGSPTSGLQLNNQLQTVSYRTQFTNAPGGHYWKHAYFEAYMYYDPAAYAQWSFCLAWWSYPVVSNSGSSGVEVDFFEQGNANSSGPAGFGVVDPPSVSQVAAANWPKNDGKWHLFGALWQYNSSTGTGQWSAYYDNQPVPFIRGGTSTYYCTTGPGKTSPRGENGIGNCMVIGNTLGNTPLYIDYVRVWQAP